MTLQSGFFMKKAIPFFLSQAITLFGSQIVAFTIVWYITLETSSGFWVAMFSICSFVPQFFMSFAGGVWADRHSKKIQIIGSDALIALLTLGMVLLLPTFNDGTPLRMALLVLVSLRSVATGVQIPAVNSAIPQIVSEDLLMKANGIHSTMQSVANFAAPVAAGAVMSVMTLRASLLIDVATAVVGIAILSFIFIPHQLSNGGTAASDFKADVRDGIRYSITNRPIGRILLLYGLFIFLSIPAGFLANLFVSRYFGGTYTHLMWVEIVGFGGMLAGGLLMSTWGGFKNRFRTLSAALALFGLIGILMGLTHNYVLYLAFMLCYGVPLTAFQAATTTFLQENVAGNMQGRIFGLLNSMYSGFLPIGMALFGPLADHVSLRLLMVVSSAILIALSLILLPQAPRTKAYR